MYRGAGLGLENHGGEQTVTVNKVFIQLKGGQYIDPLSIVAVEKQRIDDGPIGGSSVYMAGGGRILVSEAPQELVEFVTEKMRQWLQAGGKVSP